MHFHLTHQRSVATSVDSDYSLEFCVGCSGARTKEVLNEELSSVIRSKVWVHCVRNFKFTVFS